MRRLFSIYFCKGACKKKFKTTNIYYFNAYKLPTKP